MYVSTEVGNKFPTYHKLTYLYGIKLIRVWSPGKNQRYDVGVTCRDMCTNYGHVLVEVLSKVLHLNNPVYLTRKIFQVTKDGNKSRDFKECLRTRHLVDPTT